MLSTVISLLTVPTHCGSHDPCVTRKLTVILGNRDGLREEEEGEGGKQRRKGRKKNRNRKRRGVGIGKSSSYWLLCNKLTKNIQWPGTVRMALGF